ncbi:MAG: hypothetical protein ABW166_19040 [Sedimenticola sp.]
MKFDWGVHDLHRGKGTAPTEAWTEKRVSLTVTPSFTQASVVK